MYAKQIDLSDRLVGDRLNMGHNRAGQERLAGIQRGRMIAAMVQAVGEYGAGNVTVAHVVERSGVSRRTFYEIFDDREDCFLAAFEDGVKRASEYVRRAQSPGLSWREGMRASLTALMQFVDDDPGMGRLLVVESLGAGLRALECRSRVLAPIILAVDEGRGEVNRVQQPPPLTAEGVVGSVFAVVHARLLERGAGSFSQLVSQLMSMIVLPFLGPAAARRELERPVSRARGLDPGSHNHLEQLEMRLTYRTVCALTAVAAHPGSSNRVVAEASGVSDQGQMSKLLARLEGLGLVENNGGGASRGEPNAWTLTDKGWRVQGAIALQSS